MAARRLVVFGDWLIQDALKVSCDACLDLEWGKVVYKEDTKGHRLGEGRPGVRRSRFLKVPCLWEATVEIASHLPGPQKLPRRHRHLDERIACAASIAARNWLVSLYLPHEVIWTEGYGKKQKTLVYRPSTGRWQLVTQRLLRLLRSAPQE